jgi:hypothetical protein
MHDLVAANKLSSDNAVISTLLRLHYVKPMPFLLGGWV